MNRDAIISALVKERDENTARLSSVVGFQVTSGAGDTTKTISAGSFLEKLQSHAPDELTRSLSDNFLFGLHVLNVPQPFLILKTGYYQNAFAGMIAWENDLENDLGPIFIPQESELYASTTAGLLQRRMKFEDLVVKNRDTRALRGANSKIIFLYSFPDKNTIVITTNADTLEKISASLLTGKLVQ